MLKFNKNIISNVLKEKRVVFNYCNPFRNFCEKNKKIDEIENVNSQEETKSGSKKHWYTYIRYVRRWIAFLIKIGFWSYSGLLLSNYIIYRKTPYLADNIWFLKIDHFQRSIYGLKSFKRMCINV